MATLGLDTATEDTAVAVTSGAEVIRERLLGLSEKGGPLHTTALLAEAERCVAAAGGWDAIEAIGVGIGPGSFTGLRVGVATARALGFSRGVAVAGVPTLTALARGMEEAAAGRVRVATVDARRGEVFAAAYGPGGERLWGPDVLAPAALAARLASLGKSAVCGGSGAVRFRSELVDGGVEIPDDAEPLHRVAARRVCEIAAAEAGRGECPVAPIYLRPPDAERWRERDTVDKQE